MQIAPPTRKRLNNRFALFQLGFRPFFLAGAVFALVSIGIWLLSLVDFIPQTSSPISATQWHAHEMLYGYGMAIIAGFLLTAVKNWTGIPTLKQLPLALLVICWGSARLLNLLPTHTFATWAMVFDIGFGIALTIAVARPIVLAKQWPQLAIVTKLIVLLIGNLLFYLGLFQQLKTGAILSQWIAIVLTLSLILMIGRRVVPFFIERGVGYPIKLKQSKFVDISIMLAFLLWLFSLLAPLPSTVGIASCGWIFALNSYRLIFWHTSGIWKAPLLWSLYLAMWLINLGFLFLAFQSVLPYPLTWGLHLFTIGGIGLMTLGMMTRVSLGHTGRDIRHPPKLASWIFGLIIIAALCRVVLPMLWPQLYSILLLIAGLLWCLAFALFIAAYASVLIRPRIDGLDG